MARSFAGGTDHISGTGSAPPPRGSQMVTAGGWFYFNTLVPSYTGVMGDSGGGQLLYVKSTGKLAFYGTGSGNAIDPGTITVATGAWVHLLYVGGVANALRLFVNGVLDSTGLALPTALGVIAVGYDVGNAGRNMDGRAAAVAYWDTILSNAEIGALARGAVPHTVNQSRLLIYWPLDGRASPEPDLSGFRYNGTLTGTAFAPGPPVNLFTKYRPATYGAGAGVNAMPVGQGAYARTGFATQRGIGMLVGSTP